MSSEDRTELKFIVYIIESPLQATSIIAFLNQA